MLDVHIHPTDDTMDQETAAVLARARSAGVTGVIAAGYDSESNQAVADMAARLPGLAGMVGNHPWFLDAATSLDDLRSLATLPGVIGIGEIGMDGKAGPDPDTQERWFLNQLDLAGALGLPVLVHSRYAVERTLQTARQAPSVRGVMHSFTGSPEMADFFLDLGWYFSFSGSVTRSKARRVHRLARHIPRDRLLLETDAPSIGIKGVIDGAVEPAHLPLVLAALAHARKEDPALLAEATTANAHAIFGPALATALEAGDD